MQPRPIPPLPNGFLLIVEGRVGLALTLDSRHIARSTRLPSGQVNVELCLGTSELHAVLVGRGQDERYLSAWCVKWEARIRDLYAQQATTTLTLGHLQYSPRR